MTYLTQRLKNTLNALFENRNLANSPDSFGNCDLYGFGPNVQFEKLTEQSTDHLLYF